MLYTLHECELCGTRGRYLLLFHCRRAYQKSQRVVRHISRGVAKSVSAAMTENHRRFRRRHSGQHRGHRDM